MTWRDRYRQASWRGIQFFVEAAETEFGRRTQLNQYPNRDLPYSEDLGRKARIFAIDGYIIGDDFYDQKESLIRAVETHGLGLLVHPYYGEVFVSCRSLRVRDSKNELRMARVSFEFEESGEPNEQRILINTKVVTDTAKKTALAELTPAFIDVYSTVRQPISEINKQLSVLDTGIALIGSARRAVAGIDDFQRKVLNASNNISAIVDDATELVTEIVDIMTFGTFPFDNSNPLSEDDARQMFDEFNLFFDFSPETPENNVSPVQYTNDLFKVSSVISAIGLIPEIPFSSLESAQAVSNIAFSVLDDLIESDIFDSNKDFISALQDLRKAVIDDLNSRQDTLSRLSTITLPEFLPAIVLSNKLYGNRDEEQDIIDRNNIEHPGFIPAIEEVEVRINV